MICILSRVRYIFNSVCLSNIIVRACSGNYLLTLYYHHHRPVRDTRTDPNILREAGRSGIDIVIAFLFIATKREIWKVSPGKFSCYYGTPKLEWDPKKENYAVPRDLTKLLNYIASYNREFGSIKIKFRYDTVIKCFRIL